MTPERSTPDTPTHAKRTEQDTRVNKVVILCDAICTIITDKEIQAANKKEAEIIEKARNLAFEHFDKLAELESESFKAIVQETGEVVNETGEKMYKSIHELALQVIDSDERHTKPIAFAFSLVFVTREYISKLNRRAELAANATYNPLLNAVCSLAHLKKAKRFPITLKFNF
jgi:hypothetical protein